MLSMCVRITMSAHSYSMNNLLPFGLQVKKIKNYMKKGNVSKILT